MLISRDCRHRLGLTVSGAVASLMKPYCCGFQIALPVLPLIASEGSAAMKPLFAASKSEVSLNGSCFSKTEFACLVASAAPLRKS
ncbi:hypothetical protein [Bradyrhizobium sp. USDA 4508]